MDNEKKDIDKQTNEFQNVEVISHILIRDKTTNEVIVKKRA